MEIGIIGAPAGQEDLHVDVGRVFIEAVQDALATSLIVVGGAGSLVVDEAQTVLLIETPELPEEHIPTASNQGKNLEDLQNTSGTKWTFISPVAFLTRKEKERVLNKKGLIISL